MPAETPRFAVFGHPIDHSLSPFIHDMFAQQINSPLQYRTIDATPDHFVDSVRRFFAEGGKGANVTLPHKRAAFELADSRTDKARRVGTANVLTPDKEGHLQAHNTDGDGMVRDLTERHQIDLRGHDTLLLGAGGAAYGVAFALLDAGIDHLTIVNRTPEKADALVDLIGLPARVTSRYWEDLDSIGSFDLIINATSAGVHDQALHLPFALAANRAVCYDLSYYLAATAFLSWAKVANARFMSDGLGMLVETAADAFELWHGKRPDTDSVYAHLRERYPLPCQD